MDTLPKVIFHEMSQNKIRKKMIASLYSEGDRRYSGVKISEFFGIMVEFITDDPDARLIVESLVNDGNIIVMPGQVKELMPEGDSEDMIVPDDYLIRVECTHGIYESYYEVEPKNFSMTNIRHIREYLEKLLKGLTLQIEKRKTGFYSDNTEQTPSMIFIFDKIIDRYTILVHHIESIINNPLTDIKKVYKEQIGSRRPDLKSQKWLSGKGASRNVNSHLATFVYEKKTYLSMNNTENKWVLKILTYFQRTLHSLAFGIDQYLMIKEIAYNDHQYQKDKLQSDLDKVLQNPFYSQQSDFKMGVKKLRDDLKKISIQLSLENKELNNSRERRSKLQRILITLERYLETDWFKEIDKNNTNKVTLRLLKDSRYAFLYKLYLELKNLENEDNKIDKLVYPRKRNYLLVEYYSVVLCIDILEKIGFQWTKGWKADTLNPLDINLPSGTIMRFDNETHWIELAYDTEVDRSHTIDQDGSYSRFVGELHRRPDIRLSLHNKKSEEVEGALIIEIKYRGFRYLWNNTVETNVMEQCRAYKNIQYYSSINKTTQHKVNHVLVLYPKQEGAKPLELKYGNSIVFIQIEPSDPESGNLPFGYNELTEQIIQFVKK